ncbi:hypothetical protein MKW94_006896 [Papaver nudicaule]|uniref:Uncharacterized protein n=1 Tax=Papaver nudicaule TaxID=74823 RepID=A0AA42AUJ6_PAPNU|nr:hypothetical protein [Papaver nudicaule]
MVLLSYTIRQTIDAQLSTMLAEQVDQAQSGLDALILSQKTINSLHRNNADIEKYVLLDLCYVKSVKL